MQHHTRLLRAPLVSIQRLKIGHVVEEDDRSLLSELLDVVQRRDWLPRLEELIIEAEDVGNKPVDSLIQACTAAGVTFTPILQQVW